MQNGTKANVVIRVRKGNRGEPANFREKTNQRALKLKISLKRYSPFTR